MQQKELSDTEVKHTKCLRGVESQGRQSWDKSQGSLGFMTTTPVVYAYTVSDCLA